MDAYVKAVSLPTGPPAHYGAKFFVFEYTGGRPAVWAVVVPPAVKPDRSTVHALMFFRPVGDQALPYNNIDDATSKSLMRYLLDPLLGPFHAVTVAGVKKLAVVQNCGFERQVSEANKPIVFISPNSHMSDYGDSIGPKWPKLLRSMMIALWAENAVGQTVAHGLTLGKTAVGGFSFGGQAAFLALQSHPEAIDELYLFDSQGFNAATLRAWFARGGKKLRMLGGGMHHSEMLALDAALSSSSGTAIPETADYWMTDRLYLTAIFMTSLVSSSLGSPPPRSLSNITGLFLNGPASKGLGISLQGRAASGKVIVPSQDVPGVGGEELAAVLAAYTDCFFDPACKKALDKEFAKNKDTPPVIPISSAAEFNRLVSAMVERVKKLRHQWCVVGGKDSTGNTDRGKDFRGFLQLCIEKGNLP
jgi:pimeloyl-ACP methyl ester carboxylesterase